MDVGFNSARIKPGDADYEYDVQKDFAPVEASGWDSASESSEGEKW